MKRRIGITGPRGFVAGWVARRLEREPACEAVLLQRASWKSPAALRDFVETCDTVVHLAGVNRGEPDEVERENARLAELLAAACRQTGATPHLVYSSTIKRSEDSPYGRGKRRAEKVFSAWAQETGARLTTLVIPNVYGAGCRPFYNSVVATFCHQLTHGERPTVAEDREVEFVWVGDLAEQIAGIATGPNSGSPQTVRVPGGAKLRISELLTTLDGFRRDFYERDVVPDLSDRFLSTLYTTFVSHAEMADHVHRPPLHADHRGDLCEAIKTAAGGQVFFSTTRPGVTRGNHYHTRKAERFCVVRGEATIRLRRIGSGDVHEFVVSGSRPEFVTIPVLHTHSIENTGGCELLTLFWTNELFDPSDADTFYEDVLPATAAPSSLRNAA